jgi:hypothetical protein
MLRGILLSFLVACSNPFAPADEPWKAGAVRFSDPSLETTWRKAEACSGLSGDFAAVKFYIMPHTITYQGQSMIHGLWAKDENAIYMARGYETLPNSVMHEQIHALLKRVDHPMHYFNDVCGPLM